MGDFVEDDSANLTPQQVGIGAVEALQRAAEDRDLVRRDRSRQTGEPFVPFDPRDDYDEYVDGKPRYDGVRSFLESRGIRLREEEIRELGDRKNELVQELIRTKGVEAYEGSVRFVEAVR